MKKILNRLNITAFAFATMGLSNSIADTNLVTNPGFESGNSGWTINNGGGTTDIFNVPNFGANARTGSGYALFGTNGTTGSISQTIAVIPGRTYLVSYYVLNQSGAGTHSFNSSFAGTTLQSINNPAAFPYTLVSGRVVTSSNSASLVFTARHDPSLFTVDDIFVVLLGPDTAETQAALAYNINALQGVSALQTSTINNSLTYDCSLFNKKGFCLSTGGRYSNVSNSHANTTGALVIASYKIDDHIRIGIYVDQNLYNSDVGSVVSLRSNTPWLGLFGVWNQNQDKTGFELKLSAGYNNSNLNITRVEVGTSEPGSGKSNMDTLAGSAMLSYGFKLAPNWITSPYFGLRHTSLTIDGYTELTSNSVTAPLTYNDLTQEGTTALVGLKMRGKVADRTTVFGSAGFEQDMYNYNSHYVATGLSGLNPMDFNPAAQNNTRAVATFGASYDIFIGHRIQFNAVWRQEAYPSVDTKTAFLTYSVGF